MNNMYRPVPFYFAKLLTQWVSFIAYPFTVSLTAIWFIGLPEVTFLEYLNFIVPMFLTATLALIMGLSIGAHFAKGDQAIAILTYLFMMFQFGGGLYVNTSSAATWFVRALSYTTPLKYSIELLMKRMLRHYKPDI